MKRILVLLILVLLAVGAAASVYADGIDESQPPALPEAVTPGPVQPGEGTPKSEEQQPRGAARGWIRNRIQVLVPRSGERGQCPLCGSTSKAEQELAIWAKVTGVPGEELKRHLSSGVGLGEICGAVVVARKQGKSVGEVIQQAKTDKVSMRVLAYAAGMSMEQFAKEVDALQRFTSESLGIHPGDEAFRYEAPTVRIRDTSPKTCSENEHIPKGQVDRYLAANMQRMAHVCCLVPSARCSDDG